MQQTARLILARLILARVTEYLLFQFFIRCHFVKLVKHDNGDIKNERKIVERAGQSNRRELMNFSGVSTGSSSLKVDIYGRNATVRFPFRFLCLS